jgi:Fe-S cluster assembly ATP-binding protein
MTNFHAPINLENKPSSTAAPYASMGPNGSGKSTLAYVLAGKTDYQLTAGEWPRTAATAATESY